MFALGEKYAVGLLIHEFEGPGVETHYGCIVKDVNGTVVRFNRNGEDWIVNTASPIFVQATPG